MLVHRCSLPLAVLLVLVAGLAARADRSAPPAAEAAPARQASAAPRAPEAPPSSSSTRRHPAQRSVRPRLDSELPVFNTLVCFRSSRGCQLSFPLADLRSRTPSASSSVSGGPEVRLGERVLVVGQRTGVVQFYGKTSFAPGGRLHSNPHFKPGVCVWTVLCSFLDQSEGWGVRNETGDVGSCRKGGG